MEFLILFWILKFIVILPVSIKCFLNFSNIDLSKEKNVEGKWHCVIRSDFDSYVNCENCVFLTNNKLKFTTENLEIINLNVNFNQSIITLQFLVNCNKKSIDSGVDFDFTTSSSYDSITIEFKKNAIYGFIIFYMDDVKSQNEIVRKSQKSYILNEAKEDTLYQICIARINDYREAIKYKCRKTKTTVNLCRNLPKLNYLEIIQHAYDLIRVNWSLEIPSNCQISEIQIRLYLDYSGNCLQGIMIRKSQNQRRINNNSNHTSCDSVRNLNYWQIESGVILLMWSKLSVYSKLYIVTPDDRLHELNANRLAFDDLILNSLSAAHTKPRIECFYQCYTDASYNGIGVLNTLAKVCGFWSNSITYKNKHISNLCFHEKGSQPWCPDGQYSWQRCYVTLCKTSRYTKCLNIHSIKTTTTSISGVFETRNTFNGYLIVLRNKQNCVQYIYYGALELSNFSLDMKHFVISCLKRRLIKQISNKFNFNGLPHDFIKYKVYLIPFFSHGSYGNISWFVQSTDLFNVKMKATDYLSMRISWFAPYRFQFDIDSFIIHFTNYKGDKRTFHQTNFYIEINNLKQCSKYCLQISYKSMKGIIINWNKIYCQITPVKSGSSQKLVLRLHKNKSVSWKHKSVVCVDYYKLIYWVKNDFNACHNIFKTSKMSNDLKNIKFYTKYLVKVEAHFIIASYGAKHLTSNVVPVMKGSKISRPTSVFLQSNYITNNIVKLKMDINRFEEDNIIGLIINLYKYKDSDCLQSVYIQRPYKKCVFRYKVKNSLCQGEIENILMKKLLNIQFYQYWTESDFYSQWTIITKDTEKHIGFHTKKISISEDLITCSAECHVPGKYSGITKFSKSGDLCNRTCMYLSDKLRCYDKNNNLKSCDILDCKKLLKNRGILNSCVKLVNTNSSLKSVSVTWKRTSILGYIALIYKRSPQTCLHATLFTDGNVSTKLTDKIRNFWQICIRRDYKDIGKYSNDITFKYNKFKAVIKVYIIILPILNYSTYGFFRRINMENQDKSINPVERIHLRLLNCSAILVQLILIDSTLDWYSFEFQINPGNRTISIRPYVRRFIIGNLEPCTEYCVTSRAKINRKYSLISTKRCQMTYSPNLENITDLVIVNDHAFWKYKYDKCPKLYKVSVWVMDNKKECSWTYLTNKTNVELNDLTNHTMFYVQVEMSVFSATLNNVKTTFSNIVPYFKGHVKSIMDHGKISIKFDKKSKKSQIIYTIDPEIAKMVLAFDIIFHNMSSHNCYIRYYVINNCVYRLDCALNPYKIQTKDKTPSGNTINCNKAIVKNFCILDKFILKFSKIELGDLSISMYARTFEKWQTLYVEVMLVKFMHASTLAGITIAIILVIVGFLIIFKMCFRNNGSQNIEDKEFTILDHSKSMIRAKVNNDVVEKVDDLRNLTTIYIQSFPPFLKKGPNVQPDVLSSQFKDLNTFSESLRKYYGLTALVGSSEANLKKNPFPEIIPYDKFRVKIFNPISDEDYINATQITFNRKKFQTQYLACQSPNEESVMDFVQMIWEQDVTCIIMLAKTTENGKFQSLQYWPQDINDSIDYGDLFEMLLLNSTKNDVFIERVISLINKDLNESQRIIHYQMLEWMEDSVPKFQHLDKLLSKIHGAYYALDVYPPYMVHCSDGSGRTGTFIIIDHIIRRLIKGADNYNIYSNLLDLRRYRKMMVCNEKQYTFIYEFIEYFVTNRMNLAFSGEKTSNSSQ